MSEPQLVSLQSVSDLLSPGVALPFRVLDAEGRLLLAQGHTWLEAH